MIILGIDPGYARCGYGILETEGQGFKVLTYGCIETSKDEAMPERLKRVYDEISRLVAEFEPDKAAVEKLFFAKNTKTALAVAQARGVILLALAENKLPIVELTAMQIKQALTGYGGADKAQMQEMTKIILKLAEIPRPDDAADALGVAFAGASWKDLGDLS